MVSRNCLSMQPPFYSVSHHNYFADYPIYYKPTIIAQLLVSRILSLSLYPPYPHDQPPSLSICPCSAGIGYAKPELGCHLSILKETRRYALGVSHTYREATNLALRAAAHWLAPRTKRQPARAARGGVARS